MRIFTFIVNSYCRPFRCKLYEKDITLILLHVVWGRRHCHELTFKNLTLQACYLLASSDSLVLRVRPAMLNNNNKGNRVISNGLQLKILSKKLLACLLSVCFCYWNEHIESKIWQYFLINFNSKPSVIGHKL